MTEENVWLPIASSEKLTIYIVEQGWGELYLDFGEDSGQSRFFVMEKAAGDYIVAPPADMNLSLVLHVLEPLNLRELTPEEISAPALERVLEVMLNGAGRDKGYSRVCQLAQTGGQETEIKKDSGLAAPLGTIRWLVFPHGVVLQDASCLLLPENIDIVSGERTLTVLEDTTYIAYTTEELLCHYSRKAVGQVLRKVQRLELESTVRRLEERAHRLEERYETRRERERRRKDHLDQQLFGWLDEQDAPASIKIGLSPLLVALRQISGYLGMDKDKIHMPENLPKDISMEEVVAQTIRNNDVFARKVTLEKDWHCHDQGPLLVCWKGEFYAALPENSHSYRLINHEDGERIPVDEAVVAETEATAYAFYRKFPEHLRSVRAWFAWAAKLCWRQDYVVLVTGCLLVGLFPLVTPLITQTVFDDIIPSFDAQAHLMVVQVMLVTLCAQAFVTMVRDVTSLRIKNQIRQTMESALWIKLLDLPASFFRRFSVGDLSNRMQGVSSVASQFSGVLSGGLFSGIFGVFNLALMFYYSFKLAGLAILLWFVYFLIALLLVRGILNCQRKHMDAVGRVWGRLLQIIGGLSVLKLQCAENRAMEIWAAEFGESWKWNRKMRWRMNFMGILNQLQPLVLNIVIYYFTMQFFDESIQQGAAVMSMANFLSFFSAVGSFGTAVSGLVEGIAGVMGLVPALERLQPVIEEKPEVGDDKAKAPQLLGAITLNNVSFRYQKEQPRVLTDINLTIPQGSFTAIVGPSGCGKSTLLRVILGMETPEKGIVEFDGNDISQLDMGSLRRQLGVVMQRGKLMAGSILTNIIGSLPLTIDDAWDAAEKVGFADDIRSMPMGMHTYISEDGGNISGGQKQRILIARSIVNHARVIVFDEATSSLDNATQAVVSDTIERLHATRIVVAHRLSTIRNADQIVVLDKGQVAEIGTYDELMAMNGKFKALAERQMI